jgi:hypothetical protein
MVIGLLKRLVAIGSEKAKRHVRTGAALVTYLWCIALRSIALGVLSGMGQA